MPSNQSDLNGPSSQSLLDGQIWHEPISFHPAAPFLLASKHRRRQKSNGGFLLAGHHQSAISAALAQPAALSDTNSNRERYCVVSKF